MLNTIINQYKNNPNFSYHITTTHHDPFHCLPAYTTQQLLINYQLYGVYTSRYYRLSSLQPGEFQFSTGLTYQFTDLETGEILGEFYGFNNPDFRDFMDLLIAQGRKFEILNLRSHTRATNLYHGKYRQYKSGKWGKRN